MRQAIKKILLGAALIVGLGGYVQWSSTQNQTASAQTTTTENTPVATATPVNHTPTPASTPPPAPTATPVPVQTGQYKNGTYTGSVASTDYGEIQVSATISGGQLADITFLAYSANQGRSIQIKDYSIPLLKTEAITAQSANVDIVSGATQTTQAFQESLGAALTKAQA